MALQTFKQFSGFFQFKCIKSRIWSPRQSVSKWKPNTIVNRFPPLNNCLFQDKTFGIAYPTMTQFITMNNHYHVIPAFGNDNCAWLGTTDVDDGVLTVTFKQSGLVFSKWKYFSISLRNCLRVLNIRCYFQ